MVDCNGDAGDAGAAPGRDCAAGEAQGGRNAGAAGHSQGAQLGVLLPDAHARLAQLLHRHPAAPPGAS